MKRFFLAGLIISSVGYSSDMSCVYDVQQKGILDIKIDQTRVEEPFYQGYIAQKLLDTCVMKNERVLQELSNETFSGIISFIEEHKSQIKDRDVDFYLEYLRRIAGVKQKTLCFFRGSIVDKWNNPVKNAFIKIKGRIYSANDQGVFDILIDKPGKYFISVFSAGMTLKKVVFIDANSVHTLTMSN